MLFLNIIFWITKRDEEKEYLIGFKDCKYRFSFITRNENSEILLFKKSKYTLLKIELYLCWNTFSSEIVTSSLF